MRQQQLDSVSRSLEHRGPDGGGVLRFDSGDSLSSPAARVNCFQPAPAVGNLVFIHKRLSILDLSEHGRQPLASRNGEIVLTFNGEIFNYLELRNELGGMGFRFETETDTEVLINSYLAWGEACVDRFLGMWAFGLWDFRQRKLLLSRDRFGEKPLFYYFQPNKMFCFGSTIRSISEALNDSLTPDNEIAQLYLNKGCLPRQELGETFFKEVRALTPGTNVSFSLAKPYPCLNRYYRLGKSIESEGSSGAGDIRELGERFRSLFFDAVGIRLRADVPVGMCLSGGLDSSAIVAVAGNIYRGNGGSPSQLKCFTAEYEERGSFNEGEFARALVEHVGTSGHFCKPDRSTLMGSLDQFLWHQEEPVFSTSMFAQWSVINLAKRHGIKVLLDGQGADEAYGGYRPYGVWLGSVLRSGGIGQLMKEAAGISSSVVGRLRLMLQAYHWRYRNVGSMLSGVSKKIDPCLSFVSSGGLRKLLDTSAHFHNDRMSLRSGTYEEYIMRAVYDYPLPHLLRFEDRNAMAFGIESRTPFTDHRIVEFGLNLPLEVVNRKGYSKWIIRDALKDLIPEKVVWRRDKVGFATPEADWLMGLKGIVEESKSDWFAEFASRQKLVELLSVRAKDSASERSRWRLVCILRWASQWGF